MSKQKLKKTVKAYLDLGGLPYEFVKVSEAEIKKRLGFGTADWDPLVAYYVRNCLVDRYAGMGHDLYPVPALWSLDSLVIAEKFDLLPLATLSGTETAVHLGSGEVFEIAAETFAMDEWWEVEDGVHEPSLVQYFKNLIEDFEEPEDDRSFLDLRLYEDIEKLEKIQQFYLFGKAVRVGDLDLVKTILKAARWNRRSRTPNIQHKANLLDSCFEAIGSEEIVEYLVGERGFRLSEKGRFLREYGQLIRPHRYQIMLALLRTGALDNFGPLVAATIVRRLKNSDFVSTKEIEHATR